MKMLCMLSRGLRMGLFGLLIGCSSAPETPFDAVDPFIGTGFHGHTYPGATVPFGGVQLSPDTRRGNWDACSGYHYSDSTLLGFSHTHLSGTGCLDLGDLLFLPAAEGPLPFSHEDEWAEPGYYAVRLRSVDVLAELTATTHAGIHRYTYPRVADARLVVDLGHTLENEFIYEGRIESNGSRKLTGYRRTRGWVDNQSIYFVAQFSQPFTELAAEGERKVSLTFDTRSGEPLVCKVGLSIVSVENARRNLEAETASFGFDFDALRAESRSVWEEALSAIRVEGGTAEERAIFYTALYHSQVVPNQVSDVNGEYRGHDQAIHTLGNRGRQLSTFSTWDTFRAWNPLMTLLDTTLVTDMIHSFLHIYETSGEMPLWPLSSGETNTMIGYHSASIIADAYRKGIRGFDAEKALAALVVSAEKNQKGAAEYIRQGFIPADAKKESVSCLLEFAYDDWCIAQLAKELGHEEVYETFIDRSKSFIHVFDGSTRFFRGKRADGNWETPFDPFSIGRSYTEATAWQYRYFVPHDVYGMTQLFGGREAFIGALDSLFAVSSDVVGDLEDVTGLIGQYAHGNEPSHHIAYLYNFVGQPWKTQQWTRRLLQEMYAATPEGIIGNEDCGQMSAWYILSSLGLYAVCPGTNQYVLTTPLFDKAVVQLANGDSLTITANDPARNRYISSVTLNGEPVEAPFVTYEQLMRGGVLAFTLSEKPNEAWGSDLTLAPYSFTSQPTVSVPYIAKDLDLFLDSTTVEIGSATPGARIYYTIDGSEPSVKSLSYREPFVIDQTTTIRARAYMDGYQPSAPLLLKARKARLKAASSVVPKENGVNYTYYEGEFHQVADLDKARAVESGVYPQPTIVHAAQADHFGYRFTGLIYAPVDGVYEFSSRSDDGSVLWIGGEKVVDNDGSHAAIDAFGRIALRKGYHPFELRYIEDYEGEHLSWTWRVPGASEAVDIPVENLFIH